MASKIDRSDGNRRSFLDALDETDKITPTDWECSFLEGCQDLSTFTPRQRDVIDKMIKDYGYDIEQW